MVFRSFVRTALPAAVLALVVAATSAAAQARISSTDIQRLQDQVYDISADIGRMRNSSSSEASRLQDELDELREEVIYLKVRMRREGSVPTADYNDVRSRLMSLRDRARGSGYPAGSTSTSGSTGDSSYGRVESTDPNTVPVNQELDVRLQTPLSSETAMVEDRFEATTVVDLYHGDNVLVPAGSLLRGVVTAVDRATRTDRKGSLTLSFDQITVRGRAYPIRATVTDALESEGLRGEAAKIGTGGAVGAIIGGIIGGVKGALIGVLVGAGGTVAATEGQNVKLDSGTVLRVRLDTPLTIR
jgi:hypothetical protein